MAGMACEDAHVTPGTAVRALILCTPVALFATATSAVPAAAQASGPQAVPGMRSLTGVWCGANGVCLGVGSTPDDVGAVVVLRANGPVGPAQPVLGTTRLNEINCTSDGGCVAVGQGATAGVVVEVMGDGTPGPARPVPHTTELLDLACPAATTCVATGYLWQ